MNTQNHPNNITITNPQNQTGSVEPSSIDKVLGNHTNSVIVAILFSLTLVGLLIYLWMFKNKLSDSITTGFTSLLSALAGYFVASLKNKE
ncbi:hypothetical protein ABE425_01335 [Chryseobacterium cucumeris]|uniref:hypothetical protein n=1 Tax=Chryseobacterium cucumeris TaxID=1813611 RepID=UPI0032090F07